MFDMTVDPFATRIIDAESIDSAGASARLKTDNLP